MALDQTQGYDVDERTGLARRIDRDKQVGEWMRLNRRAAERMALPDQGPELEKGYRETTLATPRDALAAGARSAQNPGEFPKQQFVDEGSEGTGKIYPSMFGNKRPADVANPEVRTPMSSTVGFQKSDYGTRDKSKGNPFDAQHYADPGAHAARLGVAVSEMYRGQGAGAAQVLAEQTQFQQQVTRDQAYGPGDEPGLVPASYAGSEKDIMYLETDALRGQDDRMKTRAVGQQVGLQLDYARKQRKPPLKRSASNPEMTLSGRRQMRDTQQAMLQAGYTPEDVRRASLRTPLSHPSRRVPNRSFDNQTEALSRTGSYEDLEEFLRDRKFRK